MTSMFRPMLALGLAFALPVAAHAADYTAQPASTLGFSGKFQGAQFDGTFKKFTAAISYDPANLASSKFDVTVDVASATTGDADRDGALPGSDFFDASKFPKAHYLTTGFTKDASGAITAHGNLTLHGVTKPVDLIVTFTPKTGSATLAVKGAVKRLDFGVGSGEYKDTGTIADAVEINGNLQLLPK
ncbi:polyisoprenoid-binding protein YceI [Luteibacter rhizovicinus]|uniref:Polyisoprenoid-binding protein YceI n=1 Tax=Luteibacter rhizovicinus TaxID=242606 RepID=A0A4R3YWN3_9GAMM|nr:YceI family protein [Luteibacter rhizovicinus]TCV95693.1 polyisoprenoid-binding protein YceI [Luteibacter rhizovicinus]